MTKKPEPKKAVSLIREAFAAKGVSLQTKEAYNLLAQLEGFKDWATLTGIQGKQTPAVAVSAPAKAQPPVFAHVPEAVADWPRWVIGGRQGDDGEDELWLLPEGATLEERLQWGRNAWNYVSDCDAVPFTVGFTDDEHRLVFADLAVGVRVACRVPRVSRYGLPMMASERETHKWLEQVLGWGYVATPGGTSLVDVDFQDTGDDSGESWWVEVAVHPDVHARLQSQFKPENVSFEHVWQHLCVGEPYHRKWDPRGAALMERIGGMFNAGTDTTLGEILVALETFDESVSKASRSVWVSHALDALSPSAQALPPQKLAQVIRDHISDAESVVAA